MESSKTHRQGHSDRTRHNWCIRGFMNSVKVKISRNLETIIAILNKAL